MGSKHLYCIACSIPMCLSHVTFSGLGVIIFQASLSHPPSCQAWVSDYFSSCVFSNQTLLYFSLSFLSPPVQFMIFFCISHHLPSCPVSPAIWVPGFLQFVLFLLGSASVCLQEVWFLQNELSVGNSNIVAEI